MAHDEYIQKLVASRRPGWSLEQPFYTSQEVFEADLERVFMRYWLFAGHTSQVRKPGDYFTFSIGSEPLIIIRGQDNQVHALLNVCRHRGSLICNEAQGNAKKLVCPYHQWVYETDGTLASARLMQPDFDKTQFGLHRVHVRVCESLIFVCLADEPPSFEPFERDCKPFMLAYEMERTKICLSRTYDVKANWKLVTENFRECYHCGGGHPEYTRAVLGASLDRPEYAKDKNAEVWADRHAHWKQQGLVTGDIPFTENTWHHATRYPFRKGFVCESLDGQPVAPLLGRIKDPDAGVFAIVTYPNFWHESSSDHYMTIRTLPISPTVTRAEVNWYVREDAVEGRDYDPDRVAAFWRATAEQDWKLCEDNQAGVNSSRYAPGPYGPPEMGIELFLKWYLKQVATPAPKRCHQCHS